MSDSFRERRAEAEAAREGAEIAAAEESFAATGLALDEAEGLARDWHNKHEGLADQMASAGPEVAVPTSWGQGDRGPAGYEDHGSSETFAEGSPCCAEDPRDESRKAA